MQARPKLSSGATIACVAPASPAFDRSLVSAGLRALEAHGYRTLIGTDRRDGHLAGSAAERAAELEAAVADPDVDAVICLRGGYGSGQLLPLLDLERIAAAAKPLIGMSDITHLHVPLAAAGAPCLWGPNLVTLGAASEYTASAFREALSGRPYTWHARRRGGHDRAGAGARAAHRRHDLDSLRHAGDPVGSSTRRVACCCSRTSVKSATGSTGCSPS